MNAGADRKVIFALLGVATVCLIGLGATLYRGKTAQLRTLQQELDDKRAQLADVQEKIGQQPKLEERYSSLDARLTVLEPALPDSAYIPTFLRQIEGLAINTGNRIITIRPKPRPSGPKGKTTDINDETGEVIKSKPGAAGESGKAAGEGEASKLPYDLRPIELKLEGTYWTVIEFLEELQRFPKMIAVNDIGFYPARGTARGERSTELSATIDLTAVVTKGDSHGTQG